jgi:hypothetical protein
VPIARPFEMGYTISMKKYALILCILFLSCCSKQHGNGTQAVPSVDISPAEEDKTKPLMIGGKQLGKFTLGDNLDEIEHINLRIITLGNVYDGPTPALESLEISMPGTIDLQGIERLQFLEHLDFNYSKPFNIEGIGKLKNLKKLGIPLTSPGPSLEFLRNMPNLTELSFYGTRRNGEVYQVLDMVPLATLKNLRYFDCLDFIIKNISALDGLEALCSESEDEDGYISGRPFIYLEGSQLYDETEKSRHCLVFDFSILSG